MNDTSKRGVFVLNTPILTSYGVFKFKKCSVKEARGVLAEGFVSAIGHEATAKFLSRLLGQEISANRERIKMEVGDVAIVFRLLERLPEGAVLDGEALKEIPYELGILEREK